MLACKISGGSREGSGGLLEPPSMSPIFKYPMKMKLFGLSETKLFHVHGIFKKNEIKSAKRTPTALYILTLFPEILYQPLKNPSMQRVNQRIICSSCSCKLVDFIKYAHGQTLFWKMMHAYLCISYFFYSNCIFVSLTFYCPIV